MSEGKPTSSKKKSIKKIEHQGLGHRYIPMENASQLDTLIAEMEAERDSKILPLLLRGSDLDRHTVTDVYNDVRSLISKPINQLDVIVDSGGGDIDAAFHLVKLLRRCANRIVTIVPRYAKSAATLLVCGGDEIILGPPSELGPLDPQITVKPHAKDSEMFSPLSIQNTLDLLGDLISQGKEKLAEILSRRVLPLSVGHYLRSIDIAKRYLMELLKTGMFKGIEGAQDKIKDIGDILTSGYPHHGYCIDSDEAKKIGLVVNCNDICWNTVWDIYMLFDQHYRNQRRKEMEKMIRDLIESPNGISESDIREKKIISDILREDMK